MPNVRFQRESLTDAVWNEALPLLVAHWREIAHYPDIPLDPDVVAYRAAEGIGLIRFYTIRDFDPVDLSERLVGYAVFFVRPNMHYKGSLQASQDVLYVDPAHRGTLGYRFIAWCDEQLKAEGVQVACHHAKAAHPQLGRVLAKLGYTEVDRIFVKRLDT